MLVTLSLSKGDGSGESPFLGARDVAVGVTHPSELRESFLKLM